jgi:dihydroorotate dehydrogenase
VTWARLLRPLLFLLPAEAAHRVAFGALRLVLAIPGARALTRGALRPRDPALRTQALGLVLPSPVGLAAGFDKDGLGHRELAALGFGFVEIGTLTARAQPGNPRPRVFRLPRDRALVNRLGFNNHGAQRARERLARRDPADGAVGVNVGRSRAAREDEAVADYVRAATLLAPVADYLVVNVSSPNTVGLRDLQAVARLRPLLVAVRDAVGAVPLLVKIAPDLADEDVDAVADLALELGLAGIVATNTTVERAGLISAQAQVAAAGPGGLSGPPLGPRALAVLRRLRARVGDRLVLVAAGGIEDDAEAWARIRAGATLVQVYTGFVYGGPLMPWRLGRRLAARARAEGFERVQDGVGTERASRSSSLHFAGSRPAEG